METERETSQSPSISTRSPENLPSEEIFQAVELLFDSFPKFKQSADERHKTALIYAEALAGYEPVVIRSAVKRIIATSKFFPAISEIIQATRPEMTAADPDTRKHTRLHASMCSGMNEAEIIQYLADNNLTKFDIDMPYFRNYIARDEHDRERLLAKQWPDRKEEV